MWQTTGAIDTLGRAAYGLDFRGFGRTQKRAADGLLRPSTCVDDVCDVLTDLRTKHEKVHLLGWSYGGLVAQRVAASTDLVDRLYCTAPSGMKQETTPTIMDGLKPRCRGAHKH